MLALASAVVFFLRAFGVVDDTVDVNYVLVAAGLLAAHFGYDIPVPVYSRSRDT